MCNGSLSDVMAVSAEVVEEVRSSLKPSPRFTADVSLGPDLGHHILGFVFKAYGI